MPTNNTFQIALFFEKIGAKVKAVEQALPQVVVKEALNTTLDNFKTENFFGEPCMGALHYLVHHFSAVHL